MDAAESDDEHSLWSRPFTFGGIKIRVEEEWGLGIGGTVWEGGVLLARYISSTEFNSARFTEKSKCVEIGAGITALPSIAAAHLCTFGQVVVTDIDECMEALAANLAANLPVNCKLTCKGQLRPEQTQDAASRVGWEIPQTVLDVAAQEFPLRLTLNSDGNKPCTAPAASPAGERRLQCQDAVISSKQQPESETVDTCYLGHQAPPSDPLKTPNREATLGTTEVVVQSLDWRDSLQHLEPPFDLLLVADVVRSKAFRLVSASHAAVMLSEVADSVMVLQTASSKRIVDCSLSSPLRGRYSPPSSQQEAVPSSEGAEFPHIPFPVLHMTRALGPVYVVELMEPLVRCMSSLAAPTTEVILAYYERSRAASEVFWELLPQHFSFEKIPEASYGASPQPAEVGLFKLQKL